MERLLETVLENAHKVGNVVVVGAGRRGRELLFHLNKEKSICVLCIFDNAIEEDKIGEVSVSHPYKIKGKECIYIIAIDSLKVQKEVTNQLKNLGISEKDILYFYNVRNYDYISSLDEKDYRNEIQAMYYEHFSRKINWQNPSTYTEIINWEKVNVRDKRRTELADKYLARKWVGDKIGDEHLTKIYGVWDNANEIKFDELPNAFVLKLNNGSGYNIIVKNKLDIDQTEVRKKLNKWKDRNYAYCSLELHYKDIVPKIICEEYLEGLAENIYDYNIYCFHGEPVYIWCIKGSHKPDCKASFYDKNWDMQPFSFGYPKDPILAPRPVKLNEMLEFSRILSQDFNHVRVDWYNMPDGRLLFGEMTFSSWSGLSHFEPEEYDNYFGNLINESIEVSKI